VAQKTKLPIRRLGLGESANAMIAFQAEEFSKALVGLQN
jgi:signal recognition particle GTPase